MWQVTYKAIEDTTLQAATASDSEASEAEDETEASAVARDVSEQPDQASSCAPQPVPKQAAPHQVPAAQRTPDQASSSAPQPVPNQAVPNQAPAAQRPPDQATADRAAGTATQNQALAKPRSCDLKHLQLGF